MFLNVAGENLVTQHQVDLFRPVIYLLRNVFIMEREILTYRSWMTCDQTLFLFSLESPTAKISIQSG